MAASIKVALGGKFRHFLKKTGDGSMRWLEGVKRSFRSEIRWRERRFKSLLPLISENR